MSYESSVKIGFSGDALSTSIVRSFVEFGWSLNSSGDGCAVLTPLDLQEAGETVSMAASEVSSIFAVLKAKEMAGDRIEIFLAWPDPFTKCHFFLSKNIVQVFLGEGTERRQVSGFGRFTDYNWYMPKLILPLTALGLRISTIVWNEVT